MADSLGYKPNKAPGFWAISLHAKVAVEIDLTVLFFKVHSVVFDTGLIVFYLHKTQN